MARKKVDVEQPYEKPQIVNMSLRLEPALYDRLRKLAFDKRVPMHGLVVNSIEKLLKAEKY